MATWPGALTAITLFVEDLDESRRFYEETLGLPLHYGDEASAVFDFGNTLINLLKVSEAPELIGPAAIGGPDAGARMQLTITVEDVDATCAELQVSGVVFLNGPVDRPWGVRTAAFADPAGHIWEIAR